MDQRITFLTIGVSDLKAMTAFYKNVFGWTPVREQDGISFFRLNGIMLGLYPSDELAEDAGIKNDGSGFKRTSMSINFTSKEAVDKVFDEICSKGARPVVKPEDVFWGGYRGYVADIENNYWELAWNPFLEMDEKGNVLGHE